MFQVIDMHCDTIPALQWKEKQEHLADADLQINLDKLMEMIQEDKVLESTSDKGIKE